MHIRIASLALVAILALVAPAAAQFQVPNPYPGEDYHVEFGAMFWTPTPGIVIGSASLSSLGAGTVDFVNEFNIANKRFADVRGVIKGGKHKLRISMVPVRYQETAVLERTLTFNGRTFNARANATTALNLDLWRFGYEHDFAKGDAGYIGFIAELKHTHVVADLRAADGSGEARSITDVKVPVPQLGVVGRVYPHKNVSITGEFTGFKAPGFLRKRFTDADTFDVSFKDFEVYGTVSITRFLGLQGGYRSLLAEYVVDDDTGDIELKGPYFGGVVRF